MPLDDRKCQLPHLGVRVDEQSLQMFERVAPAPEAHPLGAQGKSLPAQGRGVVGQRREQERRRGAPRPEPRQAADSSQGPLAHRRGGIRQPAAQHVEGRFRGIELIQQ